jgi:hypothetical protein
MSNNNDKDFWELCDEEIRQEIEEEEKLRERNEALPKIEVSNDDPEFNKWLCKRIDVAEKIINDSTEGNLHTFRIKASNLLGGLVPHYLSELEADEMLQNFVSGKTKSPRAAHKDITDGIKNGMKKPIYFNPDYQAPRMKPETGHKDTLSTEWVYKPTRDSEPANPEPLVKFCDAKILTRGNISMLSANAGQGKTNICACLAVSGVDQFEADTLGFSALPSIDIWYLDTEMSKRDHWVTWDRACRRVGYDAMDLPQNIHFRSLRGGSLEQKKEYLWNLVTKNPDLLILDGIGDFVVDVNDSEECNQLITQLCSEVHNRNIGVFTTLHLNPGVNNKARGHLGSELWRRCECNITIKETEEKGIREITTDFALGKNRGDRGDLSLLYKWDSVTMMHVTHYTTQTLSREEKECIELASHLKAVKSYGYGELKRIAMTVLKISESTAKRRISEAVVLGYISKIGENYFKIELGSKSDLVS